MSIKTEKTDGKTLAYQIANLLLLEAKDQLNKQGKNEDCPLADGDSGEQPTGGDGERSP